MSPRMAMIEMEAVHGTNVLSKGHIFETDPAATMFLQNHCFN